MNFFKNACTEGNRESKSMQMLTNRDYVVILSPCSKLFL
jgi:hypothetical protein